MSDRSSPQAGGFLLALAILVGTVAGGLKGQPTIGLLAGLGIGLVAATALWLVDRQKRGR
jgi:NADH:ubiquinone oxidoreductase subunit 4 (subunit M)